MSNKIVDTRKYNKDKRARLGRFGDTKIREIDGKPNHVTSYEAFKIDLDRKSGEDYAKAVGSGTVNPITGLQERWNPDMIDEDFTDDSSTGYNKAAAIAEGTHGSGHGTTTTQTSTGADTYDPSQTQFNTSASGANSATYNELSGLDNPNKINEYLAENFGADPNKDYSMYFNELQRGEGDADDEFDFIERAYETDKKNLALKSEREDEALGRQTVRGMGSAMQGARSAMSKSGFATQGSVTTQLDDQMRNLSQDFGAGQKAIGEDYGIGLESAATSFDKDMFGAQKNVTDDFYDMVSSLTQSGAFSAPEQSTDSSAPGYVAPQSHDPNAPGYEQEYSKAWHPTEGSWGIFGQEGAEKTCVLSTAAYEQNLITKEQLMSFVKWRLKTQHKEFLGNAKWLGYQIAYKPISQLMLKYKWVARIMKKLVLDRWLGVINGKKAPITKFIVEGIALIGFILNYKKAMKLGRMLKANPKAILMAYKDLIKKKELEK